MTDQTLENLTNLLEEIEKFLIIASDNNKISKELANIAEVLKSVHATLNSNLNKFKVRV
ncbi:hypothetical protein [Campylobacter pinnipediorum]|uniref:hypothetical protein n=1 Tax=Campylobacter pinnipediorum TaxID=1965231 RepID=UPI0009C3AD9E|nr:hypothetical protein [Campylobacter pinnipediorum]AQW82548.1 hypothetical protein CPIN17261_0527 [Campylobacter pinnipediorum subsp. pinnipediorum]